LCIDRFLHEKSFDGYAARSSWAGTGYLSIKFEWLS
jgi:hypothetical protein